MNEIFSFRKELNIKKIIIVILIIILILGVIIWKSFSPSKKNNSVQEKISSTETNFYSRNKEISLKVSNSYDFTQITPNSNYILELRNKHNLNIFITKENLLPNITLSDLVEADLKSYVSKFKNSSNISNVSEVDRGEKKAYTYSLHYLDANTKTAFYLQTIWIEHNSEYYIIDIEFPLNTLNENSKIINDVLNSIIIN